MLLQHILHLCLYALAVMACARLVPGIHVRSFTSALVFALAFAVLDKLLFWVLVIVSFPMVVLSAGLFIFVINAFLFWLADKVTDGVKVDGMLSALAGALVTSLINSGLHWALGV